MKITNLRIGNVVFINNDYCVITGIINTSVHYLTYEEYRKMKYENFDTVKPTLHKTVNLDQLKSIYLTSDILLKVGFKEESKGKFTILSQRGLGVESINLEFMDEFKGYYISVFNYNHHTTIKEIFSLHTLQNFYYEIEERELVLPADF